MNDERDERTTDRQVGDTYRELAKERVPQQLSDAVLRMAASEKAPWSMIPALWMKPIAWAATIGLSLAIVLELTQPPAISPDISNSSPVLAADDPALLSPVHIDTTAESTADDRRERQVQAEETTVVEPPPAPELQQPDQKRRALKPAVHRAEMPVTENAATEAMKPAPGPAEAAALEGEPAATDADNSALGRAGNTPTVSSMAVTAEAMRMVAPSLCPEEVRESAEEWYRCIEAKRPTSAAEAIDSEIEALRRRYPDYPIPEAHR